MHRSMCHAHPDQVASVGKPLLNYVLRCVGEHAAGDSWGGMGPFHQIASAGPGNGTHIPRSGFTVLVGADLPWPALPPIVCPD
jgi:hypothetical protein